MGLRQCLDPSLSGISPEHWRKNISFRDITVTLEKQVQIFEWLINWLTDSQTVADWQTDWPTDWWTGILLDWAALILIKTLVFEHINPINDHHMLSRHFTTRPDMLSHGIWSHMLHKCDVFKDIFFRRQKEIVCPEADFSYPRSEEHHITETYVFWMPHQNQTYESPYGHG